MTRVLIVRLGSLGDLVHTLPAVAAIRRAHPDATIDWLVDAVHREFLTMVPVISSIVALRDRTVGAWLEARRTLRDRAYDVAVDFQGLLKSAALARLSGARRVIGFDRAALREGAAAPLYTERVFVGEGRHVIEKNLRLAAALEGVGPHARAASDAPEFPLASLQSHALDTIRRQINRPFALINPGAAWPNKRWPADRFGQLASWLRDTHGLASVVLWGPGEQSLADEVVSASSGAAIAAPETRLIDLVALSREASLMVSGDTGPIHIAAATGTAVVGLFGPTNPKRNGPWRAADVSITRYDACDCHYERQCRRATGWCLGEITVEEVAAAVTSRLAAQGRVPC